MHRTEFRIARWHNNQTVYVVCKFIQEPTAWRADTGEAIAFKRVIEVDRPVDMSLMEFEVLKYAEEYLPESWRGKYIEVRPVKRT